jgi:predicted nuclease of predicted toxin-antitoxin system
LEPFIPGSMQVRLVGPTQADDREIWDYAGTHGFALVSLDADFAERATLNGPPPKVIWLLRDHVEVIETFERDAAACLEIY